MNSEHEQLLEAFNDSLETCTSHPAFLDQFYDFFVNASPEIAAKFRNTDLDRQKQILKLSLYMLLMAAQGKPEGDAHLKRIAEKHDHNNLDIKPEFYTIWLDCLVKTAKMFDGSFTKETERAWRYVLQKGIDFMVAHY